MHCLMVGKGIAESTVRTLPAGRLGILGPRISCMYGNFHRRESGQLVSFLERFSCESLTSPPVCAPVRRWEDPKILEGRRS